MCISVWDSGDREVKKSEMESQPRRGRGKGCPRWSEMNPSTSCGAEHYDEGLRTHEVCISGKTALERRLTREILSDVCSTNQGSCHIFSWHVFQGTDELWFVHWWFNLAVAHALRSSVQSWLAALRNQPAGLGRNAVKKRDRPSPQSLFPQDGSVSQNKTLVSLGVAYQLLWGSISHNLLSLLKNDIIMVSRAEKALARQCCHINSEQLLGVITTFPC